MTFARLGGGTSRLEPREKYRVAFHELGHAQDPSTASRRLGCTLQLPNEHRFVMTESELADEIAILLRGPRGRGADRRRSLDDIDVDVRRIVDEQHGRAARLLARREPLRHTVAEVLPVNEVHSESTRALAGARFAPLVLGGFPRCLPAGCWSPPTSPTHRGSHSGVRPHSPPRAAPS